MLSVRKIVAARNKGAPLDAALRSVEAAIAVREPEVQAFSTLDLGGAIKAALASQGPLAGVPVGVKDIIDVAGLPTRMGSPLYADWMPRGDAAVTTLLRRAGASIIGKTHTTPFAFLDPAPTRNPYNADYSPGGSSAGSAAGVAAGMIALGIGTQTGGSIIRPASYCGVAAIKPSFRLLPTVGVKCYSWSCDTLGLFAASVADVAYALAVMTGRDDLVGDESVQKTFRIGITRQAFAGDAEPASQRALDECLKKIMRAGHTVMDVTLPQACADAWAAHPLLSDYEAVTALGWEWDNHREALPPKLRAALDAASQFKVAEYDNARRIAKT
ncbi:MAG: amidase family protein, partial [Beijerinckiaceae bacterium]